MCSSDLEMALSSLHGCPAPAKLNLFLHVTGRRPDGYHLLQSVFQLIDKSDTLDFDLRDDERMEIRKRFADSGVTLVGIGSNERYDSPDAATLKKAIEATKEFVRLSHDVGGTGVKVKPDSFHKDVPREKTIEQIGKTLNELGEYASGFGQQIRLEVHGQCQELPTIKAIMDIATHEQVAVCWNSNPADLQGEGLDHNFQLVSKRFGETCHIHELEDAKYPFRRLFELLVKIDYPCWLLMEASSKPEDRVAALAKQRELFEQLRQEAQKAR